MHRVYNDTLSLNLNKKKKGTKMRHYKKSLGATILASMLTLLLAACGGGGSSSGTNTGGGGGGGGLVIGAGSTSTFRGITFSPAIGTPLTSGSTLTLTFSSAVDTTSATITVNSNYVAGNWNANHTVYTVDPANFTPGGMLNITASAVSATRTVQYEADKVDYNVYSPTAFIYVNGATGSDASGVGSTTAPYASIEKAMSVATAGKALLVAGGTYNVDSGNAASAVRMTDGVSLYGGFSSDFSARNPATFVTTLTDTATAAAGTQAVTDFGTSDTTCGAAAAGTPMAAITVPSMNSTTQAMFIDGFTIDASSNSGTVDSAAVNVNTTGLGTLYLTNSTLNGGNGSAMSAGLYDPAGNTYLYGDTASGGGSASTSAGVYTGSDTTTIRGSTLNGGSGGTDSIGLFNDDVGNASLLTDARYSTIRGGSGGASYGVYNSSDCAATGSPVLVYDTISGGSGGTSSTGIRSGGVVSMDVYDDTVEGGTASTSTGILAEYFSSNLDVEYDTVSGGSGTTSTIALLNQLGGYMFIENSILFTENTGASSSICYDNADGTTQTTNQVVSNNDLTACPTALYAYPGANATTLTAPTTIQASGDTLAQYGNVSLTPVFVSSSDWHLTSGSPAEVLQGGLDLSGTYGYTLTMPGDDMDGTVRILSTSLSPTNTNAAGMSMGAYAAP